MQGCISRFYPSRSFVHAPLQLVFLKALFPYHFPEVSRALYFNSLCPGASEWSMGCREDRYSELGMGMGVLGSAEMEKEK
jgi:hypothetical protein